MTVQSLYIHCSSPDPLLLHFVERTHSFSSSNSPLNRIPLIMQTSSLHGSPLRISDLAPGKCDSNLSRIRFDSFGPCSSSISDGDCSSCFRAKCYPQPSAFASDIRRNWSTGGESNARARRPQLRSLEGQTSFATFTGEPTTPCDSCNGRGWLVCDFCEGQKVNVQAKNNRIYRRCPSCRTAGVVICPRCKVFRCVSFPDEKDTGMEL